MLVGTCTVTAGGRKLISQAVRHDRQGGGHTDAEQQGAHEY